MGNEKGSVGKDLGSAAENVVKSALLVSAVPQRIIASTSPAERQEVIDGTIHTVLENLGYAREDALKAAQHVQGGVRNVLLTLRDIIGLDGTEESDCDN